MIQTYNIRNRTQQGNVVIKDGIVSEAAFAFRFMLRWSLADVIAYVDNRCWKIKKVE